MFSSISVLSSFSGLFAAKFKKLLAWSHLLAWVLWFFVAEMSELMFVDWSFESFGKLWRLDNVEMVRFWLLLVEIVLVEDIIVFFVAINVLSGFEKWWCWLIVFVLELVSVILLFRFPFPHHLLFYVHRLNFNRKNNNSLNLHISIDSSMLFNQFFAFYLTDTPVPAVIPSLSFFRLS